MEFRVRAEEADILARVRDILAGDGVESYLVGGYIRDRLLDQTTRDIDIAVTAPASDAAQTVAGRLGGRYVLLDEKRQIARVVFTREDSGDRWHLDFSTVGEGIHANLGDRDFTIDALSLPLQDLDKASVDCLLDPFGGVADVESRTVRAVRDSVFADDPARLLRAVRLAASYGLQVEPHTEGLIRSHSGLIAGVAGERVREELCMLLRTPTASRSIRYLDSMGLLTAIIPELEAAKGVEQPVEHYWDVFNHSVETVAAVERILQPAGGEDQYRLLPCLPAIPDVHSYFSEEVSGSCSRLSLLKLAALLHDVAKPQTKTLEPGGRARFLGHTKEGATVAGEIMQRLRFSTRETKMVQKMVESHLRLWQMGTGLPTRRAIYRFFRDTEYVSIDIIFLTLADFLAVQGPELDINEWRHHCELMEYIWSEHQKEKARIPPEKLLDGHVLMEELGLQPGPELGRLLEDVREAQGIGEVKTREEALAFVKKKLARKSHERASIAKGKAGRQ